MHKCSVSSHIFAPKHYIIMWMEAKSKQMSKICSEVNIQNGGQNHVKDRGHATLSPEGKLILRKPLSFYPYSLPL